VLHSFAVAIGLAVSSTAPTWRDASFALVALSGLYLVLSALISSLEGAARRINDCAPPKAISAVTSVASTQAAAPGKHRDGMPPSLLWGRQRPLTRGQGKSA
jgi:hypothetical protein